MSTHSLPEAGAREYPSVLIEDLPCPVKRHQPLAHPGMPKRYESEEEEVSEADTPSREDVFFSTTDVESEISGFESDTSHYADNWTSTDGVDDVDCDQDDDTFTLRMSTCLLPGDEHSRPTSVYTIKPARNSGGLAPMPLLHFHKDSDTSLPESNTSSRPSSPSTSYESSPPLHLRTFYSDTLSSDEDQANESHFLTATPVTYYAPNSRPSLVSVSQSLARPDDAKVSKKPRKQRPASISRQTSTGSNRNTAGVRPRLPRSRTADHDDRRSWNLAKEFPVHASNSSHPTVSSSPSDITSPRSGYSSGSSLCSGSDIEQRPQGGFAEKDRKPIHAENVSRRHMSYQPPQSLKQGPRPLPTEHRPVRSETSINHQPVQSSDARVTGFRTRADHSVPLPNTIGMATSSPRPSISSNAAIDPYHKPRRGSHNSYRPPPLPPTPETHRAEPKSTDAWSNKFTSGAWKDPFSSSHIPFRNGRSSPPSPVPADRTQSISSMASGSSKFSLSSTFDTGSVRSMMHRYRRPHHDSDTTSPGSTSGRSTPYSDRSQRGMLGSNASKSTTNLSFYSANIPADSSGERRKSTLRRPQELRRPSEQLTRPKGTKWLSGTSETVSQVGNKAFTGFGSILRKKPTSSG